MSFNVKTLLHSGAQLIDAALERLLPSPDTLPHSIHRAMRHSTFAGGKRLRPILCMEAAKIVTGTDDLPEGAADLGAALEMLHTYSLIHDDLPALDITYAHTLDQILGDILTLLSVGVLLIALRTKPVPESPR